MKIQSPFTSKRYAKELKKQYPFVTDDQASSVAMLAINGWVFSGHSEIDFSCAMTRVIDGQEDKFMIVYAHGDF